jgi:hypothetical protein
MKAILGTESFIGCSDKCSDIQHFVVQFMHTTLKNVELSKYFKINEAAPTCFGLQRNHHQGATASTWLKLHTWFKVDT